MKLIKTFMLLFVLSASIFFPISEAKSGFDGPESFIFLNQTDAGAVEVPWAALAFFFDLRDRETYIQLTNPSLEGSSGDFINVNSTAHVQIYDVSNNCNENNFYDVYTPSDTHVYNMRDIQTNDGNPSGVVLPDNSYGIVLIFVDSNNVNASPFLSAFGNFRIIDENGYEYRTNAQAANGFEPTFEFENPFYSFNFNQEKGVIFSDVVGITTLMFDNQDLPVRWYTDSQDVANTFYPVDVDIIDLNEVPFSCRNVIFSCVDQDNPRLEELLENAGTASVASFEYGINNAIPHSKGGELLCPGNNINEGVVKLTPLLIPEQVLLNNDSKQFISFATSFFYGYVGLNNGNKRGSFDSFWYNNIELQPPVG